MAGRIGQCVRCDRQITIHSKGLCQRCATATGVYGSGKNGSREYREAGEGRVLLQELDALVRGRR